MMTIQLDLRDFRILSDLDRFYNFPFMKEECGLQLDESVIFAYLL